MNFWNFFYIRPPKLRGLKLGQAGEAWAAYLYQKQGHKIVARNYAVFADKKLGELDIICQRKKTLTIVEVRTRSNEEFMNIEDTVDRRKQHYLRRMTKIFLKDHSQFDRFDIQIDVVGILLEPIDNSVRSVKIIENAIEDSV